MKRRIYTPDLADFINNETTDLLLTDDFKARILQQFLRKFRMEFDTEMEFQELLDESLARIKQQLC